MRLAGLQFLLLASLLAACDIHSVARSDQALGQALSVGAWLDPKLEPLNGCEALNGVWSNQGNQVRDATVKQSVFAAEFMMGEKVPDAVFADTVTLAYNAADGLLVSVTNKGKPIAALNIEPRNIACGDPAYAVVARGEKKRLAVDASGALWLDEGRYPSPGTQVCKQVGFWTHAAPNGMATVVPGGNATLMEPADPTQRILVKEPITGVRVPATAIFMQPGSQTLPLRVWFQADSQWSWSVPTADGAISAELESCHVYALVGQSQSTTVATASLIDLGDSFDWRDCHPRDNPYEKVTLGSDALTAAEGCFHFANPNRRETEAMPARVIPATAELTLTRATGAEASEKAQP